MIVAFLIVLAALTNLIFASRVFSDETQTATVIWARTAGLTLSVVAIGAGFYYLWLQRASAQGRREKLQLPERPSSRTRSSDEL